MEHSSSTWKPFDSFGCCSWGSLHTTRADTKSCQLRANYSPLLRQDPLVYLVLPVSWLQLAGESRHVSWSCMGTIMSNPVEWSSPSFWCRLHVHVLIITQLSALEISRGLSVQPSPLWYSALQASHLVFPTPVRSLPSSARFLRLVSCPGNYQGSIS